MVGLIKFNVYKLFNRVNIHVRGVSGMSRRNESEPNRTNYICLCH